MESSNLNPTASPILDAELRKEVESLFSNYPNKQAAVLPALHVINAKLRYVPPQAVVELAAMLELTPAQVQDAVSFYGFFKQDKPQGKYRIWACRSISCAACGGEELLEYLSQRLGVKPGETSADGLVSLEAAECLGACDQAPAMLVNEAVHGNMRKEKVDEFIVTLSR